MKSSAIAFTFLIGCCGGLAAAEPPLAPVNALDAEWRAPVERFRDFLVTLSAGKMEDAYQQYRVMTPYPPKTPQNPFEPDPYDQFMKGVGRFPSDLESLSVIGERRFTPNSRKFTMMCDTRVGPVIAEVMVFRSRGEWFFGTMHYQILGAADAAGLKTYDDLLPPTRYSTPVELEVPAVTTPMETVTE